MNQESAQLRVGVGRADITPPLGTPLSGYPDPRYERRAEAVHDPLYATALVFEQGKRRAALISLDVILIEDQEVQRIREAVSKETGIAPEHVLVCATHTHSGPNTHTMWGWCEADRQYIDQQMTPGAVAAVRAARKCVPVRVGIGVTHSDLAINRRQLMPDHHAKLGQRPWGPVDAQMTVLRFEGADQTVANLVHYGAHPTVLGRDSRVISRDWPGVMVDRLERTTGAVTLFVHGTSGDVAPFTGSGRAVGDGDASLWEAGARAAMDALRAWRSIKDLRDLPLGMHAEAFELPYRPMPSREEARRALSAAEPKKDQPGQGMSEYLHWQAVVALYDRPIESGKIYGQSLLGLGPVAVVPMPGEPFAELSLRLRDESPFQHTLCAGTSCGQNGYLLSQEELCRGGYERWVARAFGPRLLVDHIDDVLVEQNLRLLRQLFATMHPPLPKAAGATSTQPT